MLNFALIGMIVFGSCLGLRQERTTRSDPFEVVPESDRNTLRQSINRVVDLQIRRDWSGLYDLLNSPKGSRDQFTRQANQTSQLISFEPTDVVHNPNDNKEWIVAGCGVFQGHGKRNAWESLIFAHRTEPKWSFSMVTISIGETGMTRCFPTVARAPR
jgi:hypothetical protein